MLRRGGQPPEWPRKALRAAGTTGTFGSNPHHSWGCPSSSSAFFFKAEAGEPLSRVVEKLAVLLASLLLLEKKIKGQSCGDVIMSPQFGVVVALAPWRGESQDCPGGGGSIRSTKEMGSAQWHLLNPHCSTGTVCLHGSMWACASNIAGARLSRLTGPAVAFLGKGTNIPLPEEVPRGPLWVAGDSTLAPVHRHVAS